MKYLYLVFWIYKHNDLKLGFNGYLPYRNNFDVFLTILREPNVLAEFPADRRVDSWAKVKNSFLGSLPQCNTVKHKSHSFLASKIREFKLSTSVQHKNGFVLY